MSKHIITTRNAVHLTDFKARNRGDNQRRQVRAQTPLRHDWRERLVETEHSDVGAWVVAAALFVVACVVAGIAWGLR